jgi:hypothetical protein
MSLTAPASRFAPEQLEEALAAAKTIDHLASRSKALDSSAPRLEPVQLGEALVAARTIGDPDRRSLALAALIYKLLYFARTKG